MSSGTKSPTATPDAALSDAIKRQARELGFALCGITDAAPPPHHRHYARWLAEGQAGEMLYLHRQEPKRGDLQQVLPGARSVVCVALNYAPERTPAPLMGSRQAAPLLPIWRGLRGTIARYARFDDYHETMWARLEALLAFVKQQCPEANGKVYCDTGPITERDLAMRAGLGWIGKHTNLISRHLGNWFFLGEILLDIESAARCAGDDALRDVPTLPARLPDRGHHRAVSTGRPPLHLLPDD